jgi:hypothetical protein
MPPPRGINLNRVFKIGEQEMNARVQGFYDELSGVPVGLPRGTKRDGVECLLLALSGRSDDRVARSGTGLKADMPNQRVECLFMALLGPGRALGPRPTGSSIR